MNILLDYESSALAAPQSFRDAMQAAVNILDATIYNNITVTFLVGYGDWNNGQETVSTNGAEGGALNGVDVSYTALRAALASHESSALDRDFVDLLPNTSSVNGVSSEFVSQAVAEALGLMSPTSSGIAGAVGIGTSVPSGNLVGVALHEISHALGRQPGGTFDLLRYTAPGVHLFSQGSTAPAAYFSIDGGVTDLADFGETSDPSDFLNTGLAGNSDSFDEFYNKTTVQNLTTVDVQILDALGFDVTDVVAQLGVQNFANAARGQLIALSSLVTITDIYDFGYQKLELWDSNGTLPGGQFVVNGVEQTGGHEIDVSPADVANTHFTVGLEENGDTLWARILQNNGTLSGWQQFSVTPRLPTLTVNNDAGATRLQAISVLALNTISDPNGFGYQTLELWDTNGTVTGGQFVVNGVAQTANHEIDVSSANVAHAVFDAGTVGGTDILWARLLQTNGQTTVWEQFSVTVPTPTVTVRNDPSVASGQHVALSTLLTIVDPGGVGYQQLELWDSNGTAAGGQFLVNGVAQTGDHAIDVSLGDVANTVFDAGTSATTDVLWARLQEDDGTVTVWQQFDVTIPAPRVTVQNDPSVASGQHVALSTLLTIADPGGVGYRQLELWDSNGTAAGGQFVVNGVAQTGDHAIDVSPGDVANTMFDAGTAAGNDTLWARLQQDDGTLTTWQQFDVTIPVPTVTVHDDPNAASGQNIVLSTLLTIADPGGVGYQRLELWDSDGTAAGGQFVVNGVAQTGDHAIDVSPGDVANTVFDAGTVAGTDTLWARLQQDDGTLTVWQQFALTVPRPTLAVQNDSGAASGQHVAISSLVTISDPGDVGYQKLELWDSNGTAVGGEFVVNGVMQTAAHEIDVSPADIANTVFDVGTTIGADTLWARLLQDDGTLTTWQQFTVTAPAPAVSVHNLATATPGQVISVSSLVTISDPSNLGYRTLELWDSDGTLAGGQFKINGAAQLPNREIDVSPANVANTVFDTGTAPGTDTLWARLQQNDGTLTTWQQFAVTVPPPTLSVHDFTTATPGQVIDLSSLVTISDPNNVGYAWLELWDSDGTVAGGQFVVNGAARTGGHEIDVVPAEVANTVFDEGAFGNTDTLWARLMLTNGNVTGWQQFQVVDPVTVGEGATLELTLAYAGHAIFAGTSGTLQLDASVGFSGTVAGMTGQDGLDLRDINFATSSSPVYSGDSAGGTLSVTDGTRTANIALLGNYMGSTFVASSDGHGGTSLIDQPTNQVSMIAQSQHA